MKNIIFLVILSICVSCAVPVPMRDCQSLCQARKVEYFRDELVECRCSKPVEVEPNTKQ